jgi:hypothetical protein
MTKRWSLKVAEAMIVRLLVLLYLYYLAIHDFKSICGFDSHILTGDNGISIEEMQHSASWMACI